MARWGSPEITHIVNRHALGRNIPVNVGFGRVLCCHFGDIALDTGKISVSHQSSPYFDL
jgi:hypothetical protein